MFELLIHLSCGAASKVSSPPSLCCSPGGCGRHLLQENIWPHETFTRNRLWLICLFFFPSGNHIRVTELMLTGTVFVQRKTRGFLPPASWLNNDRLQPNGFILQPGSSKNCFYMQLKVRSGQGEKAANMNQKASWKMTEKKCCVGEKLYSSGPRGSPSCLF